MKKYQICIESYFSNKSDFKEYDNYYVMANSYKSASEIAKNCIDNWNKNSKNVIFHIFNITPTEHF